MVARYLPVGLAAVLVWGGLAGIVTSFTRRGPSQHPPPVRKVSERIDRAAIRAVLAVSSAASVLLVTNWPVGALWAAALGAAAPTLADARRNRKAGLDRTEALATWMATLRGLTSAGLGLREALIASADVAPGPIESEVAELARSLKRRTPIEDALDGFRQAMNDPTADRVAMSIGLAARTASGRLAAQLASHEHSTRRTVEMRREIDAKAEEDRATVRGTAIVSLLAIPVLNVITPGLFEPASTAAGQAFLGLTGLLYAGGLAWMARMERFEQPDRIAMKLREATP